MFRRLDFRRLPCPVFDHFTEQRLVVEPKCFAEVLVVMCAFNYEKKNVFRLWALTCVVVNKSFSLQS